MIGIKGKIKKNGAGSIYDGIVWDRFLAIELTNNVCVEVFDSNAISNELSVGDTYNLICCPTLLNHLNGIEITGIVVAINWLPSDANCNNVGRWANDENLEFILVEISIGTVVLIKDEVEDVLGKSFAIGDELNIFGSRIDLVAICEV